MRFSGRRTLAIATALLLPALHASADSRAGSADPAGELPLVEGGAPAEVELVLGPGRLAWPAAVRDELAARVRAEWPSDRTYGAVLATLGVDLRWPLVGGRRAGAVRVPVVEDDRVALDGRLRLPETRGPRRVVVLLDASSSANELAVFEGPGGARERLAVLDAERRALLHLVDALAGDWLEFGVIAFGETTWPVVEPGASAERIRAALAEFAAAHPHGEGRTDAICALWTAWDWLADTPSGVEREIVVLTDGDAPFSGRFAEGPERNTSACPASHRLSRGDGPSDPLALVHFGLRLRGDVTVTPLVFEPERRALAWRQLAERTGGRIVRVPGPGAIDAVLPALVASRIARVVARNTTTGTTSADLLQADRARISGVLELAPGANDVELAVESDRGTAALFRFRIYSAPHALEEALAKLRERSRALELRAAAAAGEAEAPRARRERRRRLELRPSDPPAAPAP